MPHLVKFNVYADPDRFARYTVFAVGEQDKVTDDKNIALLKASPDLLAALKKGLEIIEGEYPADDWVAAPVVKQMREAIAAAGG